MIVNARFLSQPVTGVQRHAIEISRMIKEIRPETLFVSPRRIINHDAAGILNPITIGRGAGYFWEQIELPWYLNRHHRGDLLINLANMAPVYYRPKLVTIHDTAPLRHPEWYSKRFAFAYRTLLPRIARKSEVVVTDSEFSRSEICSIMQVSPAAVKVVYCAVPQTLNAADTLSMEVFRSPYILCVASLDPRKNLRRLLDAFFALESPDLKLVVVGASNSTVFADRGISDAIEGRTNVVLAGAVDDARLRNLYANAELFVYPSLYEGFGLPPLEAMACGCPCLVARVASLPEICADAAEYCDPEDSTDIEAKMRSLLADSNKMNDLRIRGRARAAEFSWRKSAEILLELAESVTGK